MYLHPDAQIKAPSAITIFNNAGRKLKILIKTAATSIGNIQ